MPLLEGRLVFGLIPELELLLSVDASLRNNGVSGVGFAAGGRALFASRQTDRLAIEASYRESHASVDAVRDIERWGLVSVMYTP